MKTSNTVKTHSLKDIFSRKMLVSLLMGFSSGLPLAMTGGTMQAWLKESGVDLTTIGLFGLVGMPYTLKFLWSPIFDRFALPFFGRRRGWLALMQVLLAATLGMMATQNPGLDPFRFAFFALLVSFFSASQDIVIDAYRREDLDEEELGLGSSLYVSGYRFAMMVSGGGALAMAEWSSWSTVYLSMGGVAIACVIVTLLTPEPKLEAVTPRSFKESVVDPFIDYFTRKGAVIMLIFMLLYKIGDTMASAMTTPFYLELGFDKAEIGAIVKVFGFWATILGGIIGGSVILKTGINRALYVFGFFQMISTAGFALLAMAGKTNLGLTLVIAFENLTGGMGTAAFTAFMGSLTNKRFTATQYALLTSFMGIPRVIAAAPTGWMAEQMGWFAFYITCTVIAIPGMALLPLFAPWKKTSTPLQ